MKRAVACPRPEPARSPHARAWAIAGLALAAAGCPERDAETTEAREPKTTPEPASTSEPTKVPVPEAEPLPEDPGEHSGATSWVAQIGGANKDAARTIAPAGDGAVVGGYVSGDVTIGDASHAAGEVDGYVTRLDRDGAPVWTRFFGGAGEDAVSSVAVGADGAIAVAGAFARTLAIGDGNLGSDGADDIFVAKLSPEGERIWARSFGGNDVDAAHHVASGPGGEIYVTGVFRNEVSFGDHTLESAGDADMFALALSADGDPLWARRFGSRGPDYGRALVPHPQGAALVGEYSLEVPFGDETLSSAGNRDIALALLDPTGEPRWARSVGGYYNEVAVDLAVDPAGNLVVTGSFDDSIDFGAGELKAEGQSDAFVAKLAPDGETLWSKRAGGEEEDVGASVTTDRFGNVIAAGWFWYTADFGGEPIESAGRRDGYAFKLGPDGEPIWSWRAGGEAGDMTRAVAVGADGRVFAAGTFHGTASIGGEELSAARADGAEIPYGDAFVAALEP